MKGKVKKVKDWGVMKDTYSEYNRSSEKEELRVLEKEELRVHEKFETSVQIQNNYLCEKERMYLERSAEMSTVSKALFLRLN